MHYFCSPGLIFLGSATSLRGTRVPWPLRHSTGSLLYMRWVRAGLCLSALAQRDSTFDAHVRK